MKLPPAGGTTVRTQGMLGQALQEPHCGAVCCLLMPVPAARLPPHPGCLASARL